MNTGAIREALHKQPFEPFSLRLADGREIQVRHPDFVAVSPGRVIVIHPPEESVSMIEPLVIVSLEWPARPAPPPTGNGGPT
jgi:hypothetical protein